MILFLFLFPIYINLYKISKNINTENNFTLSSISSSESPDFDFAYNQNQSSFYNRNKTFIWIGISIIIVIIFYNWFNKIYTCAPNDKQPIKRTLSRDISSRLLNMSRDRFNRLTDPSYMDKYRTRLSSNNKSSTNSSNTKSNSSNTKTNSSDTKSNSSDTKSNSSNTKSNTKTNSSDTKSNTNSSKNISNSVILKKIETFGGCTTQITNQIKENDRETMIAYKKIMDTINNTIKSNFECETDIKNLLKLLKDQVRENRVIFIPDDKFKNMKNEINKINKNYIRKSKTSFIKKLLNDRIKYINKVKSLKHNTNDLRSVKSITNIVNLLDISVNSGSNNDLINVINKLTAGSKEIKKLPSKLFLPKYGFKKSDPIIRKLRKTIDDKLFVLRHKVITTIYIGIGGI